MSSKNEADSILSEILSNRRVSVDQVKSLEQFVKKDWVVDRSEAELMFKINQALGDNDEDCPEWCDFFVATVTRLVVMDMESPGEIDVSEGDWLGGLFEQYSIKNSAEQRLCSEIATNTSKIEGKLASRVKPLR